METRQMDNRSKEGWRREKFWRLEASCWRVGRGGHMRHKYLLHWSRRRKTLTLYFCYPSRQLLILQYFNSIPEKFTEIDWWGFVRRVVLLGLYRGVNSNGPTPLRTLITGPKHELGPRHSSRLHVSNIFPQSKRIFSSLSKGSKSDDRLSQISRGKTTIWKGGTFN